MKTFKINKDYQAVCDYQKTRNGFKHTAKLIRGSYNTISETKVCYLNRTWESFEYETVLKYLLSANDDLIPKATITKFFKRQRGEYKKEVKSNFSTLAGIMAIGNLINDTQKDKNDWKMRMLKAGLGGQGLIMPDDWDSLPEDEKETRLNNIIKEFQNDQI